MTKVSKNNPLISVIVPVYNVEKYLNRCVDSIINQTYKNIEIILVDDGSPDNCPKICDDYTKKDKRIKVIHKKNGGLSDARNVGIDNSKGIYLTFIDSDDYVEKNYIIDLLYVLEKYNADMSASSIRVIYNNGKIINNESKKEYILNSSECLKNMLYDCDFDVSANSKLYKRTLFNNIKFPKNRLFEDAATTYKVIDACSKIAIISVDNYNYYIRNNSITTTLFNNKKMDLIKSTSEMCDFISKKYPELNLACERRLMYAYLSTLSQLSYSKKSFPNEQKILMGYISKNRLKVLKNKNIKRRDRIALICTIFGFKFYKVIWNIYTTITNRR